MHKAENELTKKLLATGLEPEGFSVPLRNMGAEVALFRDANLPLFTEQRKIATQYDKIVGAQIVGHAGEELIHLFALAMKHGITATELRQGVYGFPTFSADIKSMVG